MRDLMIDELEHVYGGGGCGSDRGRPKPPTKNSRPRKSSRSHHRSHRSHHKGSKNGKPW